MNYFQWIFIPVFCLFGITAIWIGSLRGISLASRAGWAFISFVGVILIAFPQITTEIAAFLGIGRGTDLVVYVGAICGIIVTRYFYSRQRKLEIMITELSRQLAISNAELGNGSGGDDDGE